MKTIDNALLTKKTNATFVKVTLPMILWVILMIIGSSIPGREIPDIKIWNWDKGAHAFEYMIFSILLSRYLFFRKFVSTIKCMLLVSMIITSYAALDEIHQLFIPNRSCSIYDFYADISGMALGLLVSYLFYRHSIRKQA